MNVALTSYKAQLIDYGIGETLAGEPNVQLKFDIEGVGEMTYYGSLKGGAVPFTLDALLNCGYKGKDCTDIINGPDSGALTIGVEVNVAIGEEEYNGVKKKKIKFVNAPGNAVQRADPVTAKAKLRALGLEAELAKARGGAKAKPADDNDIPF